MQIKVDASEIRRLAAEASEADKATAFAARTAAREVSRAVEKRVKLEMPVDTGRARASWGHWTPRDVKGAQAGASEADAIWLGEDGGLTITQGSNVEYIEFLNAGHSRQAPVGFIDRAALFGQLTLEDELGLIDPLSAEHVSRLYVATNAGGTNF